MSCKVLAVVGPTAVGKSTAAVQLARRFSGEIINGDSVAVYRRLDIGSAKIPPDQRQGIPHHLLDYVEPDEPYDVRRFQQDGRAAIARIAEDHHLPIVAGGTGLYVKALLYDYEFPEEDQRGATEDPRSTEELVAELKRVDPASAEKIHPHNRRRILRALQIASGGTTKSQREAGQSHQPQYDTLILGLTCPREELKRRIDARVDQMMADGLAAEVEQLSRQVGWQAHSLQAIGYKEFQDYFAGRQTLEETVELIKIHTRQFAKRQYTWWRHQMTVSWYDITEADHFPRMTEAVEQWLRP